MAMGLPNRQLAGFDIAAHRILGWTGILVKPLGMPNGQPRPSSATVDRLVRLPGVPDNFAASPPPPA
jgi:hypothetical protein